MIYAMAGSIKVHFLKFNLRLFACNALSGDLGCFCVGIMPSVRMSQMYLPGCVYHDVSDVSIRMSHMCLSGCLMYLSGYLRTCPDKRTSEGGGMASGVGKRRRLGGSQAPKNALNHLHEMKPGSVFEMESQTGPVHAPVFTMSVTVNREKYSGTGHNKRVAKQAAAESALCGTFFQFRNSSQAQQAMGGSQLMSQNFTEIGDIGSMHQFSDFENSGLVGVGHPSASNGDALHRSASDCEVGVLDISSRNPIVALHELRPGSKYELLSEFGRGHNKVFTMSVVVDEEKFEGCGCNKKMAKYHAAKAALVKTFSVKFPAATGDFSYVFTTESALSTIPTSVQSEPTSAGWDFQS